VTKTQASNEYIARVNNVKQANQVDNQKSTTTGPSVSRLLVQDGEKMPDDNNKTIYEFCQEGNEQRVEQMLKKQFDVNQPDDMKLTLLHWAADRGNESMIRLLVRYGANLNAQDGDGQTALFNAAHSSNIPCVKLLLSLGADPTITDNDGQLPSSIAQTDEERNVWKNSH